MTEAWPSIIRRVTVVRADGSEEQELRMIMEEPLSLHINGQQAAVLMRLPGMEKELAAGFLVSEGLVDDFRHILVLRHCGLGLPEPGEEPSEDGSVESRNRVEAQVQPDALNEGARLDVVRLIRAGCGAVDVDRAELPLRPLPQDTLRVSASVILGSPAAMRDRQELRQNVGGVHAAALFTPEGELAILCEDVGRHNAVDKAIGWCLLRGVPLSDKLLLCSGRLSYEMVTKAIRAGLPIIASVSAPTALAVSIAESLNLTLIGYVRGGRMTIYTHPQRVLTG